MRKEINLDDKTIIILQRLADNEKRLLKNYMELVLFNHARVNLLEENKQISLLENIKLTKRKKKK